MAVRREYIADQYRNLLGREGSEGEISGWANAPDEQSVYDMFVGSPEYTSTHGGQATWNDVGGQIQKVGDTPPPVIGPSPGENHTYDTPGASPSAPIGGGSPVADYYTKYLGRPGSADEISKWLSGVFGWGDANNLAGIERGISTSEEAARHRASTPTESYSGTPYTGFQTGGNDYSAFNTGRQQDPGKSAKDAFAMISNQAPPPPFNSKAGMANWFNTYVRPGMDALGHKVISVNEDGFTYSNHEGTFFVDFGQNSGAATGSMLQRLQWNATPADDATRARYPQGSGTGTGSGTGKGNTVSDLRSLYNTLGQQYGGPGGAGVTNGPLQQVGQDPLSFLITGALADLIGRGGSTPFGQTTQDQLSNLIASGGRSAGPRRVTGGAASGDGVNDDIVRSRYESARELLDKGRRTMINDLEGDLTSRNLMSEPGIEQGAHIGGLNRITEKIAPEFSRALRDIYTDESAKADARMMTSLQLATGFSTEQARTLLAGIGEGTARQSALADIALRSLQTNMAWSQFLAEFGLKRDQVMYEMQNGNIEQFLPLLQSFIQLGGMAAGGHV